MKTTIPFTGFYESIHSMQIDSVIEYDLEYYDLTYDEYESNGLDYHLCCVEYAKEYADVYAADSGINLQFEYMSSPREYNFTTDIIFCDISLKEVKRVYSECDIKELAALVTELFTSRDGFSSFYSNNLNEWGPVEQWDHNQVGTLLECFYNEEIDIDCVNEVIADHLAWNENWKEAV